MFVPPYLFEYIWYFHVYVRANPPTPLNIIQGQQNGESSLIYLLRFRVFFLVEEEGKKLATAHIDTF